jgi:hypothetical protein
MGVELAITYPLGAKGGDRDAARHAAVRHGVLFLERNGRSAGALAASSGAEALLVVGTRQAALFTGGKPQPYHPGMGALRLKRLRQGERGPPSRDGFLEAADLRPGETVLDCTLGLGGDALVAAGAVGPGGRVVGLESSPALAAFVAEGLARYPEEAARRVEVIQSDHLRYLVALPDRSFDVVAFDPMFTRPLGAEPAFEVVRRLAEPRPLSAQSLRQARRVARRWVVVKDCAPGRELGRLGLSPLPCSRRTQRLYGRIAGIQA